MFETLSVRALLFPCFSLACNMRDQQVANNTLNEAHQFQIKKNAYINGSVNSQAYRHNINSLQN